MELLCNGGVYLLRTRSTDGSGLVTVPNPGRIAPMYPLFSSRSAFFHRQGRRELERLLWDVYRHDSNYKLQGLAVDLRGGYRNGPAGADGSGSRAASGGLLWRYWCKCDIAVYVASGRGNTPEAEIEHLQKLVAEAGGAGA